jgi:phospholipid transport system substrate-binding protein
MKKIILFVFITISLFAVEKENIVTLMESRINKSTSIVKQKDLTSEEKKKQMLPLFEGIFDYELMTKLSLGKTNWTKMSSEQKAEFTDKFITKLKNSYLEKVNLYTDEKLHIIGLEEVNPKRILLLTELIGNKDTYDVTYKFYKAQNDDWLIYDVDIVGVSLIQVYRAQFNDALQEGTYQTLLSKLDKITK